MPSLSSTPQELAAEYKDEYLAKLDVVAQEMFNKTYKNCQPQSKYKVNVNVIFELEDGDELEAYDWDEDFPLYLKTLKQQFEASAPDWPDYELALDIRAHMKNW